MKIIRRYKILFVFIIITIIGVLFYYLLGENSKLWVFYSTIDTASAVALSVLAFFAYYEMTKSEDVINIYFRVNNQLIDTNLSILRKDCKRSEVLGILGMIQKDSKSRFDIKSLKNPKILNEFQNIQKNKSNKLVIDLTQDELKYFILKNKNDDINAK